MLTVADAYDLVLQNRLTLPTETVPLGEALGRVLRAPVRADRDFPPFDRVAMDGIAIRFSDYENQRTDGDFVFRVVGMQRAGQPQQRLSEPNTCLEVMTGAMLPTGADTVIRYEDILIRDGQALVTISDAAYRQNVHHQATDRRAGDELLSAGMRMGPAEVAVAASVGQTELVVSALPRVALISTGDELVGVADTPLPYQIRQSNTYLLQAALRSLGINATLHRIVDDEGLMAERLGALLADNDLLLLSGGVSAGKADFVPSVLVGLGVEQRFHKIDQRPGKPLWFGTAPGGKTVFGLPGNPVSTVLCAYRYVMPYLRASLGLPASAPEYAQLASPFTFRPDLTYFLTVRLSSAPDGRLLAHPLPGSGSADFANLLDTNAFMELPPDQSTFDAGQAFPIWRTL
ncbi:molybdopterin molybdotransferase MoeA [Spirosoma luteolum]